MTEEEKSTIQPTRNGSYLVKSLKRLKNQKGEDLKSNPTMLLCRCGRSSNKPYCDGTHLKIGFSGQKEPDRLLDKMDNYKGKHITIHDNRGVEAVIDKDLASARLGIDIDADILLILTAVENVFIDFGRPSEKPLHLITVNEAEALLEEGQFGVGSMEPKIRASIKFLKGTPRKHKLEVIITMPERAMEALGGEAGTRIVLDSDSESSE